MFGGLLGNRKKVAPTKTAGSSGTLILAGYVENTETNPALTVDNAYTTYSEMLKNVDIIGASVRYYLNLGGKATWTVTPPDDSPAAEAVADFTKDVLKDMRTPFFAIRRLMLMSKYWGFTILEWTAKRRDDGKIGFLDIESRPQHTIKRWDTDEQTGHVNGMWQTSPLHQNEIYLPRTKVVYSVDSSLTDSPEGLGLFRHMAATSILLSRYLDLEKVGFENDLRGTPKARIPYQLLNDLKNQKVLTEAEINKLIEPVEAFIKNHLKAKSTGVTLDSSVYRDQGESKAPGSVPLWDMEIMTSGGTGAEAIAAAIERCQRQLARIAGTEGLLLGGDKVGSLALSEDKSQNFAVMVDAALVEATETADRDIIGTLMKLNGISKELWPSFKAEQVQFRSVTQLSQLLLDLAQSGSPLMPGDPAINVIRGLAGLPDEPEVDDEDLALRGTGLETPGGPPPPKPEDTEDEPTDGDGDAPDPPGDEGEGES